MFSGKSFGAKSNVSGEAVFTTSLVGYPESLTDPSYRGQILVFTQPLIGNYGVPSSARDENGLLRYFESPHLQAVGVVVADVAEEYSHWTAVESLSQWCAREGVPAISGNWTKVAFAGQAEPDLVNRRRYARNCDIPARARIFLGSHHYW